MKGISFICGKILNHVLHKLGQVNLSFFIQLLPKEEQEPVLVDLSSPDADLEIFDSDGWL